MTIISDRGVIFIALRVNIIFTFCKFYVILLKEFVQLDMPPWWIESHDRNFNSYHNITEAALCEDWKRAAGLSNEWFDQSLYDKNYERSHNRLTERGSRESASEAANSFVEKLQ